jgi:RNA polymerase sigma-70 factor, ECF subfamily
MDAAVDYYGGKAEREAVSGRGTGTAPRPPNEDDRVTADMAPELDDKELLRAYATSRKSDLLGEFLVRYEGRLLRFVLRLAGGDYHAAQDIVQETFTQVARAPDRLLEAASYHNWLLAVARNICVSRIRHEAHARRYQESLRAQAADGAEDCPVSSAMEARERAHKLRAVIDRLPERYRELLLLKVQEEKSYREIAEITGLTVTNVGFLLHRAMKELSLRLSGSKEVL